MSAAMGFFLGTQERVQNEPPVFKPLKFYSTFQVKSQIFDAGFLCDADLDHSATFNKKVRNAQVAQYNFIFGKLLILLYRCL